MFFVSADDSSISTNSVLLRGENGDILEVTTGYPILDLFNNLVRDLDDEKLNITMDSILEKGDLADVVDLFVLTFQTRDCRGGKGERALFHTMFKKILSVYPDTAMKLLPFVPMFGYVKDLVSLLELDCWEYSEELVDRVHTEIISILVKQLIEDYELFIKDGEKAKISLTAKWIPKEGCHFHKTHRDIFISLTDKLSLEVRSRKLNFKGGSMKVYRKLTTTLNKHLDTSEIKMCSNHYAEINFAKVPSIALNKWRKAFLNEKLKDQLTVETIETGNRYPDREDRVTARKTLRTTVREGKVKGGQLFPHTITNGFGLSCENGHLGVKNEPSLSEKEVLEGQWKDLVDKSRLAGGRAILPMADVSGSMYHCNSSVSPIEVCVALSILLSEITHPAFKDRVLTFNSDPKWVSFADLTTVEDKIKKLFEDNTNAGSTNLQAALEMILETAVDHKLKSEDIPDLCIFSDMQFDQACVPSGFKTCGNYTEEQDYTSIPSTFKAMKKRFSDAGLEMPRVIFWNLAITSEGYATNGDTPNTVILSGFSQSLLKYVMYGTLIKEKTPYDILRDILDSERYQCIRDVLIESSEGILSSYSKKEEEEVADSVTETPVKGKEVESVTIDATLV